MNVGRNTEAELWPKKRKRRKKGEWKSVERRCGGVWRRTTRWRSRLLNLSWADSTTATASTDHSLAFVATLIQVDFGVAAEVILETAEEAGDVGGGNGLGGEGLVDERGGERAVRCAQGGKPLLF